MRTSIAILLALLSAPLFGQSLIKDAHQLADARRALVSRTADTTLGKTEAYANMLAILQHYDNIYADSALHGHQLLRLPARYADNPLLADWLPLSGMSKDSTQPLQQAFTQTYRKRAHQLRVAPRENMTKLLLGKHGTSPADYLSVSRTLQAYSVPPVESQLLIEAAAAESNSNIQTGGLNAPAVIEGLFRFVVERAQQEIAVSFLDRFLEEEIPPVELLFPTVFKEVGITGLSYSHSYLERVRTAFYEDLQLLSVRLPSVLLKEERFRSLQTEPFIYNLLSIYSIIGLSQKDLPVSEAMAVTHHNLFENYRQNQKKRNFVIADSAGQQPEELEQLSVKADSALRQLRRIYVMLNDEQNKLDALRRSLGARSNNSIPEPAILNERPDARFDLEVLMGDANNSTVSYRLNFLPYLLRGELDREFLLGIREVETYDYYFGKDRSPRELRAAGLELTRNLFGNWYNDQTIASLIEDWIASLTRHRQELLAWGAQIDPSLRDTFALNNLKTKQRRLAGIIQLVSNSTWKDSLAQRPDLQLQLDVLTEMAKEESLADSSRIDMISFLRGVPFGSLIAQRRAYLQELEERFLRIYAKLTGQEAAALDTSNPLYTPLDLYFQSQATVDPTEEMRLQLAELKRRLSGLKAELANVDAQLAPVESSLISNASPMLFVTESLSQLMYCLHSGRADRPWITRDQLREVLSDNDLRVAFLGLLYQRLRQVKQFNRISPDGMAQLVQLTVEDLQGVLPPEPANPRFIRFGMPTPAKVNTDSLKKVALRNRVSFLVNTLRRMIETPLVSSENDFDELQPLKQQHEALALVPTIGEEVADFILHLNEKHHQAAMGSLIRIFSEIRPLIPGPAQDSTNSLLSFLTDYGYFVGGLVDAQSGAEVQSLLNGIADPPGSSRIKRRRPFAITLNSYVGASVGHEWWRPAESETAETFWNVAPAMPVGIAFSFLGRKHAKVADPKAGKLPNKPRRGGSYTFFASLIDLGSLFSYQFDSGSDGNTELTFKNMFKPGIQFQYNFPKSPFYTGVGAQYGPHFRDINGDSDPVQSTRIFFNIGIDIPLKTLYLR